MNLKAIFLKPDSTLSMVIIAVILFLSSCNSSSKKIDPFYTDRGDWDDFEVPLIKPYKMIILNGSKEWGMNMEQGSMLEDIREVNVINGVILAHCKKTIFYPENVNKEAWAIIIPSKNFEKIFAIHYQYVQYLKSIGFEASPELYDVNDVAEYAGHYDIVNWKEIKSNN